jgi:hypothetical protein
MVSMILHTFHADGYIAIFLQNQRRKDLSKQNYFEGIEGLLAFELTFNGFDHPDLSLASVHFQSFVGLYHELLIKLYSRRYEQWNVSRVILLDPNRKRPLPFQRQRGEHQDSSGGSGRSGQVEHHQRH